MSVYPRPYTAALAAALLFSPSAFQAKAQNAETLPALVITSDRIPVAPAHTGTAIQVYQAPEIEAWGARSLADVLRGANGLEITEQGGPGGLTNATLRGSSQGQTLVLVDGLRIGDPGGIAGEFDFSSLPAGQIERIEVLRGPQSALYGSDAMGGVINIITKKGAGKPGSSITVEGGSFGTISTVLRTWGSTERISWSFSFSGLRSDGFSRYGYRIGRIEPFLVRPLESDKTAKLGGHARISYIVTPGTEIEIGFQHGHSRFHFDNPGAFLPAQRDTAFNRGTLATTLLFGRIRATAFEGRLENSLTLFGGLTDRFNRLEQSCFDSFFNSYNCNVVFRSQRIGAEYQGTLKAGIFGTLVFGLRSEREEALNREQWHTPPMPVFTNFNASQTTNSVYLLDRINFGDLHISVGGRIDSVDGKNNFATWRTTAAYTIRASDTILRASAGTGARAPSLFQRFSQYGTPNLRAERNFGIEAGVDQHFMSRRLKASVTVFDTRYRDLIDFNFALNGGLGGYFNVGRARMSGAEAALEYVVVPEAWRLRAIYTRLRAIDLDTSQPLLRRARDKAAISVIYTGMPNLEAEARMTAIGHRIDVNNDFPYNRVTLRPYAKLDFRASYKMTENIAVFARLENLTNARYEEIRDYGTAGRSIFAGMTVRW